MSIIDNKKKSVFDKDYADLLYEKYKSNDIDDSVTRDILMDELRGKRVLILAPGYSMISFSERIKRFILDKEPAVISLNFIPNDIRVDYAFFSNKKRYDKIEEFPCKTIVTSNASDYRADYTMSYNSLTGSFCLGVNSLIMLLKLLKNMEVMEIFAAGADGYKENSENYYDNSIHSFTEHGENFNAAVRDAIRSLSINVQFVTPSAYDK